MTWTSGSTLTLSAYRNIAVNANITAGNPGYANTAIILRSDNTGVGQGTVTFGAGVKVGGSSASNLVSIFYNPTAYTTPTNYSANAGLGTTITLTC